MNIEEIYGQNYRGKSATEIMRSRAPTQTSEQVQEQIEAFLAKDGIIKRYDNLNVEILS